MGGALGRPGHSERTLPNSCMTSWSLGNYTLPREQLQWCELARSLSCGKKPFPRWCKRPDSRRGSWVERALSGDPNSSAGGGAEEQQDGKQGSKCKGQPIKYALEVQVAGGGDSKYKSSIAALETRIRQQEEQLYFESMKQPR